MQQLTRYVLSTSDVLLVAFMEFHFSQLEFNACKLHRLERKKTVKLKSPNFHVSRTRLIMYNMPKSLTERELKKLCIDAVTSRATKQKPVIRQVSWRVINAYSFTICIILFT